jgi:elongation factor Tu
VIRLGDPVEVVGLGATVASVCTGLETFGRPMDRAEAGDNAAMLLRGVRRRDVQRGQVACLPGSLRPHGRFRAQAYVLTAGDGGRRTPFSTSYQPQFHFRTANVVGTVELGEVRLVVPGDTVELTVGLGKPVAMSEGLGFAIREGGRTAGAGAVTAVLD